MEYLWCHEKKRSKRVLLWCDVDILSENTLVLKNKQVSTFLSENLISMKSRSREVFEKNCDLISLLSLTQIDLDIGTTIKGMMFHHRPIISATDSQGHGRSTGMSLIPHKLRISHRKQGSHTALTASWLFYCDIKAIVFYYRLQLQQQFQQSAPRQAVAHVKKKRKKKTAKLKTKKKKENTKQINIFILNE